MFSHYMPFWYLKVLSGFNSVIILRRLLFFGLLPQVLPRTVPG